MSDETLRVEEGSLYPALHRLEEAGWIKARWTTTETGRRARVYEITAAGRRQLESEEIRWKAITAAVGRILKPRNAFGSDGGTAMSLWSRLTNVFAGRTCRAEELDEELQFHSRSASASLVEPAWRRGRGARSGAPIRQARCDSARRAATSSCCRGWIRWSATSRLGLRMARKHGAVTAPPCCRSRWRSAPAWRRSRWSTR